MPRFRVELTPAQARLLSEHAADTEISPADLLQIFVTAGLRERASAKELPVDLVEEAFAEFASRYEALSEWRFADDPDLSSTAIESRAELEPAGRAQATETSADEPSDAATPSVDPPPRSPGVDESAEALDEASIDRAFRDFGNRYYAAADDHRDETGASGGLRASILRAWMTSIPTEPGRLSKLLAAIEPSSHSLESQPAWQVLVRHSAHKRLVNVLMAIDSDDVQALAGPAIFWPLSPPHDSLLEKN